MRRVQNVVVASTLLVVCLGCGSEPPRTESVGTSTTTTTLVVSTTTPAATTTAAVTTTNPPATTMAQPLTPTTVVASTLTPPAPPTAATVPNTQPHVTVAPTTAAPVGPTLVSFIVTTPAACAAPDATIQIQPTVVVIWSFKNVDDVFVAIDNENGPYQTRLPPSGELEVPYACPGPHTFYAVATGSGIRYVAQQKVLTTAVVTTSTG